MDPNNPRPMPESKPNPAPLDWSEISAEHAAALATLTTMGAIAANCHKRAMEISSIRESDPHLLADVTPERALAAMSTILDQMLMDYAGKEGITVATAIYTLRKCYAEIRPDPARAIAQIEAARTAGRGAPTPVRPVAPFMG